MRLPCVLSKWVKVGTVVVADEITSSGIWELVNKNQLDRAIAARVTCAKGSGADPVGAAVSVGIKTGNLTPEEIGGASMTLPTLASTTATIPLRIYPDGRVCLTVASLPAGASIIAEVVQ